MTQILDPNPGLSWSSLADAPLGPDAWRCEVVTTPGTYPFVEYEEEVARGLFPFLVHDGPGTSPEEVVARIAATGAVGIKLYFEDGFGDQSRWPLLDDDTVGRIREAAHAHGLLLFAHANAWDMYAVALRNQVDIMAHGLWNWGPDNGAQGVPAGIARLLDTIARRGTGYQPTTQVMAGLGGLVDPAILDDPAVTRTTSGRLPGLPAHARRAGLSRRDHPGLRRPGTAGDRQHHRPHPGAGRAGATASAGRRASVAPGQRLPGQPRPRQPAGADHLPRDAWPWLRRGSRRPR